MILHCVLVCIVSDEKSAVFLIILPLSMICLFSLVALKVFSLSVAFSNLIMMCLDVSIHVFILCVAY